MGGGSSAQKGQNAQLAPTKPAQTVPIYKDPASATPPQPLTPAQPAPTKVDIPQGTTNHEPAPPLVDPPAEPATKAPLVLGDNSFCKNVFFLSKTVEHGAFEGEYRLTDDPLYNGRPIFERVDKSAFLFWDSGQKKYLGTSTCWKEEILANPDKSHGCWFGQGEPQEKDASPLELEEWGNDGNITIPLVPGPPNRSADRLGCSIIIDGTEFVQTEDLPLHGRPILDAVGKPQFMFYNQDCWAVTGKQWKRDILEAPGQAKVGAFYESERTEDMSPVGAKWPDKAVTLKYQEPLEDSPGNAEDSKFQVRSLLFGHPAEAAMGVRFQVGLHEDYLLSRCLKQGVNAVRREFELYGDVSDKQNFNYVLFGTARDPACYPQEMFQHLQRGEYHGGRLTEAQIDTGHDGYKIKDFWEHPMARAAELEYVHVLVLRLYTSTSFRLFNNPLRNKQNPHPLKMSCYFLNEAVKRLRSTQSGTDDFCQAKYFWRGLKNMDVDVDVFQKKGGTERGMMSTSASKDVAFSYANSEHPLIFKYKARGLGQGVSLQFLSIYPGEEEYLYPSLTFLLFEEESVENGHRVITVTPQMA